MEADDLASADDLWWAWAVLADTGGLPDAATAELDPVEHVLTYHHLGSWLAMQRIGGGRAVLWGRVDGSPRDATTEHLDVLEGAPDWANSNAVWRSIRTTKPGFLAWYSRDGWDTNTSGMFEGAIDLITPLLRADPRQVAEARCGQTESTLLRDADGVARVAAQGAIRKRLRVQIHRQMRDTAERDRGLPVRPTLLARWIRIAAPQVDFTHTVLVDRGELVVVQAPALVPEPAQQSLTNVLLELHRSEAGEESGAWMVAQVQVNDGRISLLRAFDSLPPWFTGPGPTLRALSWEMQQRSPRWRPAWAALLPN